MYWLNQNTAHKQHLLISHPAHTGNVPAFPPFPLRTPCRSPTRGQVWIFSCKHWGMSFPGTIFACSFPRMFFPLGLEGLLLPSPQLQPSLGSRWALWYSFNSSCFYITCFFQAQYFCHYGPFYLPINFVIHAGFLWEQSDTLIWCVVTSTWPSR